MNHDLILKSLASRRILDRGRHFGRVVAGILWDEPRQRVERFDAGMRSRTGQQEQNNSDFPQFRSPFQLT